MIWGVEGTHPLQSLGEPRIHGTHVHCAARDFFLNTPANSGFREPLPLFAFLLCGPIPLSLAIFHFAEVVQQPKNADGLTGLIFFPSNPEGF